MVNLKKPVSIEDIQLNGRHPALPADRKQTKSISISYPWAPTAIPPFKVGREKRWKVEATPEVVGDAYYLPKDKSAPGFALYQKNRGKWDRRPWMSFTQLELQSHMVHIAEAHGHTLVAGLGMGLYLYNICGKEEVTSITVIEKDPVVIELFKKLAAPEKRLGWHKVTIINECALEPNDATIEIGCGADHCYVDIWEVLFNSLAFPETKHVYRLFRPKAISWWGMEWDYGEWLVANHRVSDRDSANADYGLWVRSTEMPVAGVQWTTMGSLSMCAFLVALHNDLRYKDPTTASNALQLLLHMHGVSRYAPSMFKSREEAQTSNPGPGRSVAGSGLPLDEGTGDHQSGGGATAEPASQS